MFSVNYDVLWSSLNIDLEKERVRKLLWQESLQQFKPETIMKAAKAAMCKSSYPPRINEMVAACEEMSKVNSYTDYTRVGHTGQNPYTGQQHFDDGERRDKGKDDDAPFEYTAANPQPPPSPLLAKYMRENNIPDKMPIDECKKWFKALRESLDAKMKSGKYTRE